MVKPLQILAVDDLELNLAMIEAMLTGADGLENMTLLRARNGREALDLLADHPGIDVVLLDLQMPILDGFETLAQLKSHPEQREIPVIVTTVNRFEATRCLSLGANDFLAHPYDPQELRLRVLNHVNMRRLLKDSQRREEALAKLFLISDDLPLQ